MDALKTKIQAVIGEFHESLDGKELGAFILAFDYGHASGIVSVSSLQETALLVAETNAYLAKKMADRTKV